MRKKKAGAATKRAARTAAKPTPKKQDAPPAGEVLDLKSAAGFLKVSKPTFYRWLAQGKIKGHKAGNQWRFYRADLEHFLRAEEPSALQVDSDALRQAVEKARKARKLPPIEWPEAETPEESTVIGTVNMLIRDAIDARASDIHLDNNADEMLVRYRVDGVLSEVMSLPRDFAKPLVSRLKLMGDMNISERRLPQNGRIFVEHRDLEFDVRVVTLPAQFGESAICRILDQSSILIGLDKLGLLQPMQKAFEKSLHTPNGMIVVTGPAGSGRTTTLYSALNLVNSRRIKIVSIEDPVEYRLRDTMQVHVNRKAGLTPAFAMRMFMHSDPDIILVGDLRDLETAAGCVNAAMTGHLVLTAMLPIEAPSVITRLIEMGIGPFIVSASVITVLAQRLVRRVCPHCKADDRPNPDLLQRLEAQTGLDLSNAKFQRGKGCKECRQTGYRGRTAIFELLEVDDKLRELIARPVTTADFRAAAIDAGMTPMLRDGIEKAAQGITTVEEVLRVLAGEQNEHA
ncbi:MAG: Flp pilus assembly complex ATPase component TadA [Armatimonadota bacterium]|nr:MAG: Flp pilus assembly complex ATPase component TadA [Armatimonadota bacterium]